VPETIISANSKHTELRNAIPSNVLNDSARRYNFGHTIKALNLCQIIYSSINLRDIVLDFLETI
jgi:hypothetical protein